MRFGWPLVVLFYAVVFVLLTLLVWWQAVGVMLLAIGALFFYVHLKGERRARRIRRKEADAELKRLMIRGERERSEALRCRGGVVR